MATGVIHSDGTIRTQGAPESAPWRCRYCGSEKVYLFNPESDLGVTVVDGDDDDNATCDNQECRNGVLRPPVRRRPRRRRQAVDMMCAKCRVRPLYDGASNLCQECDTPAPGTKPSNPKDAIGSDKIPLTIFPETAVALGALALLDGACKYGIYNYRAVGIRASIYLDACRRHLAAFQEGEECASDSNVDHLGHALACIGILIDARAAGKMTDDRKPRGGYHELVERLTPLVAEIKARHADKSPKHYSIADNESIA